MDSHFTLASYRCRVHAGEDALAQLPGELKRLGVRRAVILSGWSVAQNSDLIERIAVLAGERCAGSAPVLQRHATIESVMAAVDRLRALEADAIVAVGAGSAIMAARCAAVLLAEAAPLEALITQYPDGRPAVSPRLDAPKVPILNILTAPTAAQNRAGSAIKARGHSRRLELFDPKTRPAAIFWDMSALATAPAGLTHSGGSAILWASLLTLAAPDSNSLAQADRQAAFDLARRAMSALGTSDDAAARLDLCIASFLLNRAEDAGAPAVRANWPMRVCYALGSGIFTSHDETDPGAIYLALTRSALKRFGEKDPRVIAMLYRACAGGDVPTSRLSADGAIDEVCDLLDRLCGLPTLSSLGVGAGELEQIRDFALRNFNADPHREFLDEKEALLGVLADSM